MKNFFSNIGWLLLALIGIMLPIIGVVYGFASIFVGLWNVAEDIGGGSIIEGIILLPFALIGVIDIAKGFIAVLEKYSNRNTSYWKFYICTTLRVFGYVGLFIAVQNLSK